MKLVVLGFVALLVTACPSSVRVEPVTVQPIHITVDVNLHDHAADPARKPD